jgi:hypothetical protein
MSTQSGAPSSLPLSSSPLQEVDLESAQPGAPVQASPFYDDDDYNSEEEVKAIMEKTEEPGMDSLRGSFGAIGTLIRLRRRATALSEAKSRRRPSNATDGRSEFSEGTGRPSSACSGGASLEPDGGRDLNVEKADPKQYVGDTRNYKVSTTSKEPLVPSSTSLRWSNSAPTPRARLLSDGQQHSRTSESLPRVPPLRHSSLHAHFDADGTVSRSLTLPTAAATTTTALRSTTLDSSSKDSEEKGDS